MANKHGNVVTHRDDLVTINLQNLLNMYSWEVTWEIKIIISPLSLSYVYKTYQGGGTLQGAPNQ